MKLSIGKSYGLVAILFFVSACGTQKADKDQRELKDGIYVSNCFNETWWEEDENGNIVAESSYSERELYRVENNKIIRGYISYKGMNCSGEVDERYAGEENSIKKVPMGGTTIEQNTWANETEKTTYEIVKISKNKYFIQILTTEYIDEEGNAEVYGEDSLTYSELVALSKGSLPQRYIDIVKTEKVKLNQIDIDGLYEYAREELNAKTFTRYKLGKASSIHDLSVSNRSLGLEIEWGE